jgi:hypothetical protein
MSFPLNPGACEEVEILICDYVDGTLAADKKAELEWHLAQCPACAELARDSAAAVEFISRAAEAAPPPELLTRILFDPPWSKEKNRVPGIRSRLTRWFRPILQPKFAMGAAMTILSFSLLSQLHPFRQVRWSDLEPTQVWGGLVERVDRAWSRTVKFYDNLKFVYQIQTTLHEWQQQDEEQRPATKQASPKPDDHKLPPTAQPAGNQEKH